MYQGGKAVVLLPAKAGYEPKRHCVRAMERRRRQATQQELQQGQREMEAAQRRMQREAEEQGELPIQDQGTQAEETQEVQGVVTAPPIEDDATRGSQGIVASDSRSAVAIPSVPRPPASLVDTPGQETQVMARAETTEVNPAVQTPNSGSRSFYPDHTEGASMSRSMAPTPQTPNQVQHPLQDPLFTPDQLRTLASIQEQAPMLYRQVPLLGTFRWNVPVFLANSKCQPRLHRWAGPVLWIKMHMP